MTSGILKALQKRTKEAASVGGVDIQGAREHRRLVRDHSDRSPPDASEADDDIPRELAVHLEEVGVVHQARNHVANVIPASSARPGRFRSVPGCKGRHRRV